MTEVTRPTISIGIPAYNEEANIRFLLEAILRQKLTNFELKEIIVISDGSTDQTIPLVKSFTDSRVRLVVDGERKGKNARMNELLGIVDGDVFVQFDADCLPEGDNFLEEITKPFSQDAKLGIVSVNTIPMPPRSFFEGVLAKSYTDFRMRLYDQINDGNTIYHCFGMIRAFSRAFYKNATWIDGYPEDSFSYLLAKTKGFSFKYLSHISIRFRVPGNFHDHMQQRQRFLGGRQKLGQYFGSRFVGYSFQKPFWVFVHNGFGFVFRHPVAAVVYLAVNLYASLLSLLQPRYDAKWTVIQSSKRLL